MLIVSLKYSPVHNAHCRALGEPLRTQGFHVQYLLAQSLAWTAPQSQLPYTIFWGDSSSPRGVLIDTLAALSFGRRTLAEALRQVRPDLLLFESSHPANASLAALTRRVLPQTQIWLLLHEPYVREKAKHGRVRQLLIAAQEWGTRRLLPYLDGVLVPSLEAQRQMREAYPGFKGGVLRVPLLFEDRSLPEPAERRYFSFIGNAVPAKGIDRFFEFVQTAADQNAPWQFQVATSTNIVPSLNHLSPNARSRLKVVSKPRLPDAEIDQAIRESWAVLAPYRRVTQSGVLPVAFMHGTPIISTREGGMPEFVIPGETGFLVEVDDPFWVWEEQFGQVLADFERLSANCRQSFLAHFDARRGPEFLRPTLNSALLQKS